MYLSKLMAHPVKASAPGMSRAERCRFEPTTCDQILLPDIYQILVISTSHLEHIRLALTGQFP